MYAAPFEYHAPASLDEALSLLREHGDDAKLLAGGHSLIPVMKLRFAQPKHLIDLRRVPGLVGIREEDGALVIGAMTTYASVQTSDLVDRRLPVLAETVRVIGDPLVRNVGTVGGSLAHADPGADLPALALALDAELRVRGRGGTDLRLRVDGRDFKSDATPLERGGYANYPGGEVFTAPLENSAEGVLVADLTVPYTVEGLVDEPIRLRFEGGRVTSIEGGRAAAILERLVADAGPGADVIAELGIGLHPGLRPRGHVMLDEKAAGTAHVAIGRNTGLYGGVNASSIHVDCVFSEPEIVVDGRQIRLATP